MTSPTMIQAEIVTAIGRKFGTFGGGVGSEYNPVAEALKERPLVFAAGVSVAEVVDFVLTAAAEVGCGIKDPPCTFDEGYKYKEAECKEEIAAAIERCAQVAEAYDGPSGKHGIAARIRALKDIKE